jgi:bifunctional DNA-binding transcriptional regulator/antitoxin component of YhaV-PrlF toxin-antitoxin module
MGMPTAKLDSKGRVLVPREIRESFRIKQGTLLRWIPLSEKIVGLMVETEKKEGYEGILAFLENLKANEIERFGKPDYRPISKSELWLRASRE